MIDNRMQLMGCKRGRPRPTASLSSITAILRGRYIYLIRGVGPCGARSRVLHELLFLLAAYRKERERERRTLDESQSYCARLNVHWGEHDTSHSRSDIRGKNDLVRLGRSPRARANARGTTWKSVVHGRASGNDEMRVVGS